MSRVKLNDFTSPRNFDYFDPEKWLFKWQVKIPRENIRRRNIGYNMANSAKEEG